MHPSEIARVRFYARTSGGDSPPALAGGTRPPSLVRAKNIIRAMSEGCIEISAGTIAKTSKTEEN